MSGHVLRTGQGLAAEEKIACWRPARENFTLDNSFIEQSVIAADRHQFACHRELEVLLQCFTDG